MAKRPSIKTPCVADRYSGPHERIAEFSASNGKGGLISIQERHDGRVVVDLYRCDQGVVNRALLTELTETLRDLEEWDGTEDAIATIKDNLRAAIRKAS